MATMNPTEALPTAKRSQSSVSLMNFDDPRIGGEVMMAAPAADGAEPSVTTNVSAAQAVKPVRAQKERLPVAEAIDEAQLLMGAGPAPATAVPATPAPAPPALHSFACGVSGNPHSIPPDTHGAVNGVHTFAPHNNRIWIHERSGAPVSDMTLDSFWNVFGPGVTLDTFDPKVLYDPFTQRFIFVACANAQRSDSCVLVAATTGDDPTAGWVHALIPVDPPEMGNVWLDYPSVGFTEDKITISLNLFGIQGNPFQGAVVFAIDKASFLATPSSFVFDQFVLPHQGGTHAPAVVLDAGVQDQFLVSRWGGNINGNGYLTLYRLDGNVAAGTTALSRVGFLQSSATWDTFSPTANFAPQLGSSHGIDAGDDRIQNVVHRHGRLFVAHTAFRPAGGANRACVQWHEIGGLTGTPAITSQGVIEDPTAQEHFAFPAIAVNGAADVLIGMSSFSGSIHASAATARRPAGGGFGAPSIFAPGTDPYFVTFGGTANRWGDYSAVQVDPTNDHEFWALQEHAGSPPDTWRTRWVRI